MIPLERLIIHYRHELISLAGIQVKTFITQFRVPFLVVSIILLSFELVIEVLNTALGASLFVFQVNIAYTATLAATAGGTFIYIIVVTIMVSKYFKKKGGDMERAKMTTIRMIVNIFACALMVVAIILALNNQTTTPWGMKYCYFIGHLGAAIGTLTTVLSVQPPAKSQLKSTTATSMGSRSINSNN